ncbi:transcriptional regulator, TetR family [Shimia gijangensis]|uniref:Transcriptional regulator, TetR family n=1 Tax=Shimia gijangensis TaxID=1470563 RepID=A0A1M6LJ73_9RHOB|nr:TetR/AcrR family transcriptional regulator [Shimia gijangensis]SHJ71227.1 transcriptional regulator, TetR family [Shimia gijangensis]
MTKKNVRGPQRTSRDDWVTAALDTLISDGVDSVKVSSLSAKLDCARSSFYWYFENRTDLLDALLDHWQRTNTEAIVTMAGRPAKTINLALTNVFSCWVKKGYFNTQLDFAVRDWARRDGSVRRALDISDDARILALKGMFLRYGYVESEAATRAKIVYFTQIGYEALDTRDSDLVRAKTGDDYLFCLTGVRPTTEESTAIVGLTGYSLNDLMD